MRKRQQGAVYMFAYRVLIFGLGLAGLPSIGRAEQVGLAGPVRRSSRQPRHVHRVYLFLA